MNPALASGEDRRSKGGVKLFVGLGNPGLIYKYSRHNTGFLIIDKLAKDWAVRLKTDKPTNSFQGTGVINGQEVVLAKPLCYMNRSGEPVNLILSRSRLQLKDILVIFDDLDLEWGRIRLLPGGGSSGHRGMESIIRILGRRDFARLRFGIGRPRRQSGVRGYVLKKWTAKEKKTLDEYLQRAADCCKTWAFSGISEAMNKYN